MSIKYEKTPQDKKREADDIIGSPIMRYLKIKEEIKFNIGDVVVKQHKNWRWTHGNKSEEGEWVTELTTVGAPIKYQYVFENELGIGYIKQLKVDGSGFTSKLLCMANFNYDSTRFVIDPDFVDHILLSDEEGFQYNKEYLNKRKVRDEGMEANRKILIKTKTPKQVLDFVNSLKVGDEFWYGWSYDDLLRQRVRVTDVKTSSFSQAPSYVASKLELKPGDKYVTIQAMSLDPKDNSRIIMLDASWFLNSKVTKQQPYRLTDETI
jgi:hypothetical protein